MTPTTARVLTGHHAQITIAHAIERAERTIDMICYAIAPAPRLNSHLQQSIFARLLQQPAAGKACRAVIASHHPDTPHGQQNNMAADALTLNGWKIHRWPVKPVLHAKLLIFDRSRMITGSHNLTTAALAHNRELSIDVTHPEAVADALEWFETIWRTDDPHGKDARQHRA